MTWLCYYARWYHTASTVSTTSTAFTTSIVSTAFTTFTTSIGISTTSTISSTSSILPPLSPSLRRDLFILFLFL